MQSCDVVVIGAGIVGCAHALAAAGAGKRVAMLERSPRARGASIRNFGMVWPIGMPLGPIRDRAMRSREVWRDLAGRGGFWLQPCGSLHLAHRDDERCVLEEFTAMAAAHGVDVAMIDAAEAIRRSPGVNPDGLLAAMWSPSECCIDAREAMAALPRMLVEHHRVDVCFGLPVIEVRGGERSVVVRTATGEMWEADVVVVCSGEDIATLYPKAYHASGIVKCKLQMLRTAPQPTAWRLGPHLAGGLTLRHYANFASCPSLPGLRERIASESAELDEYGIHVMAAQNGRGELVLGDSHEYANDFEPAERALIENLMLRELGRILRAPDLRIAERWHGIYAKRMKTTASGSWTEFIARPEPRVWLVNGIGGAGMTLSFGLAQEVWAEIQGGPMVATSPRSDSC